MTSKHQVKHPIPALRFCGYSDAGKTTLIESLVERLSENFAIGYLKHDAHGIAFDPEGKDTGRIFRAGAASVMITDSKQVALRSAHSFDESQCVRQLKGCDALFIEGWKASVGPKIVVIDDAGKILDDVPSNEVIAYVGQDSVRSMSAPYFHRDDVAGITALIESWLNSQKPKIFGLVLAGGRSERMRRDKSLLRYHSVTQAQFCYDLLVPHCEKVFVSCREDQLRGSEVENLPQIHDRFSGFGPMGGMLSAFESNPRAAWLTVACDLPFLNRASIENLIQQRAPKLNATCYDDMSSKLPEPLCAIYEPKMRGVFFEYLQSGIYCPRKVLINEPARRLQPLDPNALMNANNPDEYQSALQTLQGIHA